MATIFESLYMMFLSNIRAVGVNMGFEEAMALQYFLDLARKQRTTTTSQSVLRAHPVLSRSQPSPGAVDSYLLVANHQHIQMSHRYR
eukprot:m.253692 g.253692  ORF g.253692 m.253692 type:complete len:87 (-) comp19591_c0_seq2:113-373(-)